MRKLTTNQFVNKAIEVHEDKYVYMDTIYTNATTKVDIVCPKHGRFSMLPNNHTTGSGCAKCAKVSSPTTEEYVLQLIADHGDRYDYSKVKYTNSSGRIIIKCPIHGEFTTTPSYANKSKYLCKQCSTESRRSTVEEFIEKATKVHGNRYDYSKVLYKGSKDYVTIVCPEHGEFKQSPNKHLRGRSCPKCANKERSVKALLRPPTWSYTNWEASGNKSADFTGFRLYLLLCSNDNEVFMKVGKTFVGIKKRFDCCKTMPYNHEVLLELVSDAVTISKLENAIKNTYKGYKYLPNLAFDGMHECLLPEVQTTVMEYINERTNKD